MIVHWWRNEQGTVVYEFSYLRSTIASDIHALAGDHRATRKKVNGRNAPCDAEPM
jgi:hypothetical protein